MEELAEDDIDILNHEKADTHYRQDGQFPIPVFSGEESVASHFALVTAYEDIKKRLKETERENSFLKKRVRLLEEKASIFSKICFLSRLYHSTLLLVTMIFFK